MNIVHSKLRNLCMFARALVKGVMRAVVVVTGRRHMPPDPAT